MQAAPAVVLNVDLLPFPPSDLRIEQFGATFAEPSTQDACQRIRSRKEFALGNGGHRIVLRLQERQSADAEPGGVFSVIS